TLVHLADKFFQGADTSSQVETICANPIQSSRMSIHGSKPPFQISGTALLRRTSEARAGELSTEDLAIRHGLADKMLRHLVSQRSARRLLDALPIYAGSPRRQILPTCRQRISSRNNLRKPDSELEI